MSKPITSDTTVRELVATCPRTRPVFERHRIDYCCGGARALEAAAAEAKADLPTLIADLSDAIQAPPSDQEADRDWTAATATALVDHIQTRHHAFMKEQLPRLAGLLDKVLEAHRDRHGEMLSGLRKVFQGLRAEIEQHLLKEEQVLFPFIRGLDSHARGDGPTPVMPCGAVEGPIRQMESEHENAGQALASMRALTSEYTLPDDACASFRALYEGLQALEADLHEHIHLENNILFPKAVELESAAAPG